MTSSAEARLARRYPKRSLFDYLLYGGLGLGVGAVIVIAAIAGLQQSNPPAVAKVRNFEVISPTLIEVEIVVQRTDPSKPATCELVAQAESYEGVGEAVVEIPAAEEKLKAYEFNLTTVKEAVTVDVTRCRPVDE